MADEKKPTAGTQPGAPVVPGVRGEKATPLISESGGLPSEVKGIGAELVPQPELEKPTIESPIEAPSAFERSTTPLQPVGQVKKEEVPLKEPLTNDKVISFSDAIARKKADSGDGLATVVIREEDKKEEELEEAA